MESWSVEIAESEDGRIQLYSFRGLDKHGQEVEMSYRQFVDGLCTDKSFRTFINRTMADCPYRAFRFETPPVADQTFDRRFEFVLLEANHLGSRVDARTFRDHFRTDQSVVVFHNLSGKSPMIVPCPIGDHSWYGHLASFVRMAPEEQTDHLWRLIGEEMSHRVGSKRLWLNTHGGGVAWLHVRIDDRPKYYGYSPYKNEPE